jgi:phenylacetate-coenzyme A ligase PaaK-like adenylate-forming protein
MLGKIASWYMRKKQDILAKKVRNAILSIPFYREKIKKNSIDLQEVKRINSLEKLDNFLQKHKIKWLENTDLIGNDFSSHLSLVPKNKRTWIQTSSGYSLVEELRKNENFIESAQKIKRKKVAFTERDLNLVIKEVYLQGLKRLVPDNPMPAISIFSRMYIYGGSGTYPFATLVRISQKFPLRVLPYGEPLSEEQLCNYVLDSIENNTNGIITTPSILSDIGKFMVENKLQYKNLKYIGMGGFKPTKEVINLGHEIGAKLIIDAYSVQECMPLGCIASGVISSEEKNWEADEGLRVMGNLCYVRVVDKNGENVSEGEEGEIRITSPFEGTFLIDYSPGDVTKLLSYHSAVNLNGQKIKLPFPLLSYDIKRKEENEYVKIKEYPISIPILSEILMSYVGYNFAIYKPKSKDELILLIPNNLKEENYQEMQKKIRYTIYPLLYGSVKFQKKDENQLRKIVFPNFHHKPHNMILSPSKQLEEELYAS